MVTRKEQVWFRRKMALVVLMLLFYAGPMASAKDSAAPFPVVLTGGVPLPVFKAGIDPLCHGWI